MGFFDDLIKNVDKGLKAVENGALEKRLDQFAETLEGASKKVDDKLKIVAEKPSDLLHAAEEKKAQLETKAQQVGQQVRKNIDII